MKTETQDELRERIRRELYKEACEAWDNFEKERLNKVFAALGCVETFYPTFHQAETLERVRNGVESGDRRAMLELLGILVDSLRAFEILPREVRLAIADGLEKMRDNLEKAKGFLPRKRGERSSEEKGAHACRVFFTALWVERYRHDLNISLDDAEAMVADESNMKQDLVHKYWKQAHREGKRQIAMLDVSAALANVDQPVRRKKKVR